MQEKSTEKKSVRIIDKTLRSRNFMNFALSSSFVTVILFYLLSKCEYNGVFDHVAADRYINTWGNSIVMFAAVFLLGESAKAGVSIIRARSEKNVNENVNNIQE